MLYIFSMEPHMIFFFILLVKRQLFHMDGCLGELENSNTNKSSVDMTMM